MLIHGNGSPCFRQFSGSSKSCVPTPDCLSFPLFLRLEIFFEFLTLEAKATSDENEKSEKILLEFGHLIC